MNKFFALMAAFSAAFLFYSSDIEAWNLGFLQEKDSLVEPAVKGEGGGEAAASGARAKKLDVEKSGVGHTDFDGFNNLNDPLYREGSKALLRKAMESGAPETQYGHASLHQATMRDAPSDTVVKAVRQAPPVQGSDVKIATISLKTSRLIKMVPADPLKTLPVQ